MARKKKELDGGGSWMDTYGDMVTLLLTFFIVLYSMSTIAEDKWAEIVRAFNTDGTTKVDQIVLTLDGDGDNMVDNKGEGETDSEIGLSSFDKLYTEIVEYLENNNLSEKVDVSQGENSEDAQQEGDYRENISLKFNQSVQFVGDSAELLPSSYEILNFLGDLLVAVDEDVAVIVIRGHTATGRYSVVDSRLLSMERAGTIANYFANNFNLAEGKIVPMGHGGLFPIAPNDTEENMQLNRRVEVEIIGKNSPFVIGGGLEVLLGQDFAVNDIPIDIDNDTVDVPVN